MRGRTQHAEASGPADCGNDVAAMAERKQRKLYTQHIADGRFHLISLPATAFGRLFFCLVDCAERYPIPDGKAKRSCRTPLLYLHAPGNSAGRNGGFMSCALRLRIE